MVIYLNIYIDSMINENSELNTINEDSNDVNSIYSNELLQSDSNEQNTINQDGELRLNMVIII